MMGRDYFEVTEEYLKKERDALLAHAKALEAALAEIKSCGVSDRYSTCGLSREMLWRKIESIKKLADQALTQSTEPAGEENE
ncbi:MAG: hypothetical protein AAF098_13445 [Pseudomonadota bacterium]